MSFIPDKLEQPAPNIPYFEEQQGEKIPGRATEKSVTKLQEEIKELLLKLGAFQVLFTPGKFDGKPPRYGYEMTFKLEGHPGRMKIAALPIKSETPQRKDRALAQALYLVRNWLEAEVYSQVYRPGTIPLVPYLIGADGKTVTETLIDMGTLPMLVAVT